MDQAKRNKQNYLLAKAAFNARDLDACVAFYAPNHRVASSSEQGASIRRFFEQTISAWPDIQITVEQAVAEDDWVMGRSVAVATHSTTIMGAAPTNQKIESVFWDLHHFDADGRIAETWNLMDGLSIMQQLKSAQARSTSTD